MFFVTENILQKNTPFSSKFLSKPTVIESSLWCSHRNCTCTQLSPLPPKSDLPQIVSFVISIGFIYFLFFGDYLIFNPSSIRSGQTWYDECWFKYSNIRRMFKSKLEKKPISNSNRHFFSEIWSYLKNWDWEPHHYQSEHWTIKTGKVLITNDKTMDMFQSFHPSFNYKQYLFNLPSYPK